MGRTITHYDDHSVEEDVTPCKSPSGEHVFVMGEAKYRYCSAKRWPR